MIPAGSWSRISTYATTNNRLLSSVIGQWNEWYSYTARGAMDALPPLPALVRDFRDQIRRVDLQVGPNPDTVRYLYDGAGQRVRTVARLGANVETRSYVGRHEVWRKTVASVLTEERTTLHVQDDTGRVAMLERKTVSGGAPVGTPTNLWRFQLDNHLGTACVETNERGALISYEEYHPYGTTAWWAQDSAIDLSSKRYRYTGMERDEHTGLQLHGARWYAPWLGRWTSADPIGIGDGANVYGYCGGRVTGAVDRGGVAQMPAPTPPLSFDQFAEVYRDQYGPLSDEAFATGYSNFQRSWEDYVRVHPEAAIDEPKYDDMEARGLESEERERLARPAMYEAGSAEFHRDAAARAELRAERSEALLQFQAARGGLFSLALYNAGRSTGADERQLEALVRFGGALDEAAAAHQALRRPVPEADASRGGGNTSVYRSVNAAGETQYVGITKNLEVRAAAHLRQKGIAIDDIPGLSGLSRADARAVEQVLIEHHGLARNGGTLLNKINSIAKTNPAYGDALKRGTELLRGAGYTGF